MKYKQSRESGMAMLLVMMSVIVVAGMLGIAMARMQKSKSGTDTTINQMVLEEAAQSGIDMVTKKLWRDYITSAGNTTRNWASYRTFLNNTLSIPINEDLNGNGTLDPGEDGNGNGKLDKPSSGSKFGKQMLDAPKIIKDKNTGAEIAKVDSVTISRFDNLQNTWLTVRSTASHGAQRKVAVQVLEVGAPTRNHAQFAILANNVSCILCHAEIRSLPLSLNTDKNKYNTFDRVKVASLESVMARKDEADSNIAGTLYSRGKMLQQDFTPYTAAGLASSTVKTYQHSGVNGKIVQSSTGAMTQTALANATKNAQGDLNQFANLYMDYPKTDNAQTDGPVPNSFPAPYPDENNNRLVDDAEFAQVINTAQGKISFESGGNTQGGAIKTGTAYGVKAGTTYTGTSLPTSSTSDAVTSLATGKYKGNLILVGTAQDPISIDGTVAVDGDVVIKGYVKGEGQLMVKGNAYIVGDVVYKDGTQFGVAPDGKENAFALVAGGNIMMGDYLTVRGVNHSSKDNDQFPDWSQYSIDTRTKNASANVTAKVNNKDVTESLAYGYFDQWSTDSNDIVAARPGDQFSFTMSELQLFNMMELNKAKADSNYTPRFYGLRASQPNNIWLFDNTKGNNQEHAVRYTYPGVSKLSNYISTYGLPANILTRAKYQYLNPANNWLSETQLRQMWWDDEQTRPSSGAEFKFDGLLYSNNSIFCIVRSKARHKSNTNGKMTIRGGVIASDLGIFVPTNADGSKGLYLNYDPRVERFIELRDSSVVTFMRTAFYFEPGEGAQG